MSLIKKKKELWQFVPFVFFTAALAPEYIAPVLTFIAAVFAVKNRIKSRNLLEKNDKITASIVIFILWMLIGAFYSNSFVSSLSSLVTWILMFCGYLFVLDNTDSKDKLDKVIYAGTISGGIAGFIGIGQMVLFHYGDYIVKGLRDFFNPLWKPLNNAVAKFGIWILPDSLVAHFPRTEFTSIEERASSTFSNPIFFATFMVMMLPFAAHCFLFAKTKKQKIIGLISLIMIIGGVAASYSRGPYIAFAITFLLLFLHGKKSILKLCVLAVPMLGAVCIFASGVVKRLFTLSVDNDISVNTRTKIWEASFEMFKEKPLFGYGTGFNNIRDVLHNTYNIKQPHSHNILFEILLENGIIGGILFLAVGVLFIINMYKLYRNYKDARIYVITIFTSVIGFFLCGMTDCLFYGLKPLQYLMMILALSQAAIRIFRNYNSDFEK